MRKPWLNRKKSTSGMHTIIYELVDEMKRAMTGLLDPVFKEVYKGRALFAKSSASARSVQLPAVW